jgi:hypothetical protein
MLLCFVKDTKGTMVQALENDRAFHSSITNGSQLYEAMYRMRMKLSRTFTYVAQLYQSTQLFLGFFYHGAVSCKPTHLEREMNICRASKCSSI